MTTILIVDDDENNRLVLSDCLEGEGYTIVEAASGEDGLTKAKEANPDLILLDVQMPGIDGHEVLQKLKQEQSTHHIPVMMVTACDLDTQIAIFLNDGAIDHIAKPFSNMVVRARVKAALRANPGQDSNSAPFGSNGKLFSFIGVKGGVGTTSVSLNIASLLASRQSRVVAVECRPYFGTFATQLGMTSADNLASFIARDAHDASPKELQELLMRHKAGFQVLLGPQLSDGYNEITPEHADALVAILRSRADYVVADLPPLPTEGIQTVVRHSDFVCVVLGREPASMRAARVLFDLLESRGVGGARVGAVVVDRYPSSMSLQTSDIQGELPCQIVGVIPPEAESFLAAEQSGTPIVRFRPGTGCFSAFGEIVDRLVEDRTLAGVMR